MLKKQADKWVKALTSGKYKQAKGTLRRTVENYDDEEYCGHCCLGVLAEINKCNAIDICHYLSYTMTRDLGLHNGRGERRDGKRVQLCGSEYSDLAHANDAGVPFQYIAEYIINNYEAL
jgi:hypothetical protein